MILWLSEYFREYISGFGVFQYLTLRIILTVITALVISFVVGPKLIRRLKQQKIDQAIRGDGPKTHLKKIGTPTMGGVMILISIIFSTLLWADLSNHYIWILLFVSIGFGGIGFADDYKKVIKQDPKGMSSKIKYLLQSTLGFITAFWLYKEAGSADSLTLFIPFFKDATLYLGLGFVFLAYLVIVGTSNAVNLTDGLDGLAILPAVMVASGLGVFAYLSGHLYFAEYLFLPKVTGAGEVAIFCAALIGAGLGFLWFNTYPAMIFMGDIGSLSIGAILGTVAIIIRQELVLVIMGGVFVLETLSVIIQVASFKMTGKRVFRMAPIHHHYELKGWPEPRVIVRFWIITLILVLIGLATIKLR